jgi:release factor glutamine methyltransferase
LAQAAGKMHAAGVAEADREADWLLAHVLACSAGALRLRGADVLGPDQESAFERLVQRRAAREPIQYILGTAEFLGLTLQVNPAVLIPRLDTETLVSEAAARLKGPVRVADIGTGSGAIAIGLASLLPEARVVAIDISPDALAVARTNAAATGCADRIAFRQGDLVAPLAGEAFDAILSNPPYIGTHEWAGLMPEVREHEPQLALTPGADALSFYRRLAVGAPPFLKPGGFLAVEVGETQAGAVQELFRQAGLATAVCRDTAGIERVVMGSRPAP